MSDCCSTSTTCSAPKKRLCPADNSECVEVGANTLRHHLKAPWRQMLSAQRYYFCDSADCDVVYFGDDGSVFKTADLRHPIGQKQTGKDKTLCYCFGVTLADFEQDAATKAYVTQQTKDGACACETHNPSGRCCLKDFPKTR